MYKSHNIKKRNVFYVFTAQFGRAYPVSWRQNILVLFLTVMCGMLSFVQAETPYYHINRSFSPVTISIEGVPSVYQLNEEADKLTDIVAGEIKLDETNTYAIEKQAAIPICYNFYGYAWSAAVNYSGTPSNYPGKIFDNVGWVRGVKNSVGGWGAYLWVLQNRIAFQSSTSEWWQTTNGIPVAISNVMVGSLGNYGPMSNVVDIGPHLEAATNNNPGPNLKGEEKEFRVDISNVFYQLSIPDIWITPRTVVTNAGGGNVQYTVTGTNISNGVTWQIIPEGIGATIQTNDDWHHANVTPGNVGTNYKVRAASADNTNFYDEVDLTVVGMEALQYKIGTNIWTNMPDPLYVCKDTTVDFKAIKAPTNVSWPSGKPVWGGVVSGSGMETNLYTFSTISTSATDYKIVTAECGNIITGRVIVCQLNVDVHSSDTNTYKIASILGTHSNHFVCVKDTGDIVLDATVTPTNIEDVMTWDADEATITSPAVGSDKTTAKLASSTSQQIPIRIKAGDNTCWSGNVWVVWATVADITNIPITVIPTEDKTRIKGGYSFKFTIQPSSIIPATESDDVPDLTASNNPAYPPPNVPDGDTNVFRKGEDLGNGVNAKWDTSRQARQNVINPDNLPFPFETGTPASFFITYTNFPSDSVVGNDDADYYGEDNDPYADPNKGKITGYDCPAATPLNSIGSVSNTFEIHFHAREFTRIQLGDKWYRISDDQLWKIHWKFKKASEVTDNQDYNEDGDNLDDVWINNGSFIATDNNDF